LEAFTQLLQNLPVDTGMAVAPNPVYVIPPNTNMIIARGILQPQSREKTTGAHRSIDFFFASRLKIKTRKQVSLEDVSCERISK